MSNCPTAMNARYVAIGSFASHVQVVHLPLVCSLFRTPLLMPSRPAGTVTAMVNDALSRG